MSFICESCESPNTTVIDSRKNYIPKNNVEYIRRRRECNDCGVRFTTSEFRTSEINKFVESVETLDRIFGSLIAHFQNRTIDISELGKLKLPIKQVKRNFQPLSQGDESTESITTTTTGDES